MFEAFPLFQLRHHPLPKEEQFGNLRNCASARGYKINTMTNKDLAESLDRCVDTSDPVVNKVGLRNMGLITYGPRHEKTCLCGFQLKLGCTSTEDGYRLEISY